MADKNKNYQQGTSSGIDSSHDAMLAFYMEKFYAAARGHLVNKYHVGFWGDYVAEALRILDRNSFSDKYSLTNTKTFKNTTDAWLKAAFNQGNFNIKVEKDAGITFKMALTAQLDAVLRFETQNNGQK